MSEYHGIYDAQQILICYYGVNIGTLNLSDITVSQDGGEKYLEISYGNRVQLVVTKEVITSIETGILRYFSAKGPMWEDDPPLKVYQLTRI